MSILLEGFDNLNSSDSIQNQLPRFECIKQDAISIVNLVNNGQCLRTTSNAYLKHAVNATAIPSIFYAYVLSVGARFKVSKYAKNNVLMQFSFNKSNSAQLITDSESNILKNEFDLVISVINDALYISIPSLKIKQRLTRVIFNSSNYVELRIEIDDTNASSSERLAGIWVNGAPVFSLKKFNVNTKMLNQSLFFAYATDDMAIDLDDIYVKSSVHYNRNANEIGIPILASAKIKNLHITDTVSNDFTVNNSDNAATAISDNDDNTSISSTHAASAVFNIDDRVGDIYAMQFDVKGRSDTDGAVTMSLVDSAGVAISNNCTAVLSETTVVKSTAAIELLDKKSSISAAIKNGAQLSVKS
ncbi:hypothetical protein [Photobacterium damselae]|uniref:Uncharacterized protein n=1 Tax=Photobacterium damselae subsp. damselae TaxID=85581 RepID=A0AAD3WUK3_PHODD|nr:hypothetical protein [Photobacterium damselae]KAB1179734.1 hypothetical protein F6450_12735 [Photobacterium damselae subsp. damselae]PSB77885.1 hypothetical protein C5F62_19430 [Photobacterium damselae subsp. damselae]PSB90811.1 hypothetical protein C5F63_00480 [Photobacterium damselae subsp. damselae]SUB90128.1 Uncharacterised protein [Photobacterium damselae]